ncbi:response regulator [Brevundimonas sp.]|uniref:response regulator n=1 Tax=Brevundimonas sp. TaxID=1871086 RepID=UPI003D14B645
MNLPNTPLGLKDIEPLIVDDDLQSLDLVSTILKGFGITKMVKCASAAEARDVLRSRAFDLAIIDCEMPDEDGYGLVRHIRSDAQGPNFTMPVLMMSAVTPRSKVEAARDDGANFTITKPVSPTILLERILWIAQSGRRFISDTGYRGPDRRFRTVPVTEETFERRNGDLIMTAQPERPLSQDEIDGLST